VERLIYKLNLGTAEQGYLSPSPQELGAGLVLGLKWWYGGVPGIKSPLREVFCKIINNTK
jgi:hypothetical protein